MKLTIKEIQAIETDMLKEVSKICEENNIDYFLAYGSVIGAIRHGGPIPWDPDADIVVPYNQFDIFIKIIRNELPDRFYLDYYDINKYYPALFPRIGLKGYSSKKLHLDVFKLTGLPNDIENQRKYIKKTRFYRNLFFSKKMNENYMGRLHPLRKLFVRFKRIALLVIPKNFIINKFDKLCKKYDYRTAKYVVNANGGYGDKEITPKCFYGEGKHKSYAKLNVRVPEKCHEYLEHFYGDYLKIPSEEERRINNFYEIVELEVK